MHVSIQGFEMIGVKEGGNKVTGHSVVIFSVLYHETCD